MTSRHIFIGDVHGMLDMLNHLLEEVAPRPEDTVIFVGDLVDKGPDPAGVVRRVRQLVRAAPFRTILVEGNHEEVYLRYRRNLTQRPSVAREQAQSHRALVQLHAALSDEDARFLEPALPFYRIPEHDILVLHAGVTSDMQTLPQTVEEAKALKGKARNSFRKILYTRFIDQKTGEFITRGKEKDGDPFWAERYDGRFGHIVFGHNPFRDGPALFPHATGIDTGAVHGGSLTALIVGSDGSRDFVSIPNGEMETKQS
ncbi:Calcineurin-like phosphoesterase [Cohaesibacter sp. ES.047]|uniref:metallophosphoesterase family protein n=1 Tax=Cohaesibacter sp. ES.047 TaxID=1798205 RepID=UPI000BB92D96|nr:metallophosphoesterase family protein [Cohaesibacter sp. ES.047]SNY94138.1 Calcineurin-like phosphoesterase [Cohaesibacter sp. ES.047]